MRRFVDRNYWLVLACLGGWLASTGEAAEWAAKPGPLTTRWGANVDPQNVWPEYPRPQLVRQQWQNLNGLWNYALTEERLTAAPEAWAAGEILVPFPVESALSGVKERTEHLWYQRSFEVPTEWRQGRLLLHFEAVDWEATVWVNGQELGTHKGGYSSFSFDISDALVDGAEQVVTVRVFDPADQGTQARGKQVQKPEGIWYTPSTGIWQTVWLEPVAETYVKELRLLPDIATGTLTAEVKLVGNQAEQIRLTATAEGKNVATVTGAVGEPLKLQIDDARLWTPDDPHLYDLQVEVLAGDEVLDQANSYFGMRNVSVGPDADGITRLLLNGEFVFQYGTLDQGFWPDGLYTPPSEEAMVYDLQVTKELGFNMVRKHVKVEPNRWYYWCDKMGLLVWQDMPNGDGHMAPGTGDFNRSPESARQFESELGELIQELYNHPSIVCWVVFNEGWGQYETKRMAEWTRQRDASRWINSVSGWTDMGVGDMHDIHRYPGPASPAPEPTRAAVLGEFGGLGLPLSGHTWQDEMNWGYRSFENKADLQEAYLNLVRQLRPLIADPGLSAAVYTQTTDVEVEVNGLLTYDREVLKFDAETISAANRELYATALQVTQIVPTSEKEPQTWSYRLDPPSRGWEQADFDAADWQSGAGGFGTEETPGSVVRTKWDNRNIWLRREFTLPDPVPADLYLYLHHDDNAKIYLNGVLAAEPTRYTTQYGYFAITPAAQQALRPGRNVIAIHCEQLGGGQYIDAGLFQVTEAESH